MQAPTEIQEEAATQSEWKLIDDSLFTFQYPGDWEMNYTRQIGLSFLAVSPFENEADQFRENVSLVIQGRESVSGNLAEFAESSTRQITDMIVNGKIEKNEEGKLHGITYREITYSGNQNDMDFKNTLRFYFHKDHAYILTLTCYAPDYDKHDAAMRKVMDTFKLK